MKSKSSFTNNFTNNFSNNIRNSLKNNKYINTYIIAFIIIVLCIYLLYFNNNIEQDAIMNSLEQDSVVENFNVSKYVDICKKRNTHFYNLLPPPGSVTNNIAACEKLCDTNNCHAFTFKNNTCYTYKGTLDSSYIDTRTTPIRINCDSRIFNNDISYGTYNGVGYMNKVYFQNNKTKLEYLDPHLEESINVLGNLYSIENKRLELSRLNPLSPTYTISYNLIRTPMLNEEKQLFRKFTTINRDIFDINIDSSKNILYTDIFNNDDTDNSILTPPQRDISFIMDVDNKDNMSKKLNNLSGIIDALSDNFITHNLRYLILVFIMIITIIILILYKATNYINEKILIVYIIIVTLLVLFITHHLKL